MSVNCNNALIFLAILGALVISCQEPDYLETYKTDLPEPSGLIIEQLSAFSLQLNWSIPEEDYELANGFLIESFSSIDSIFIDSDSAFSMLMDNENTISRSLIVPNSDTSIVSTSVNDTVLFEFIDYSAFYKGWNYYRVTVMFDDIESYSILTGTGYYFEMPKPEDFRVEQLNDFQLKLSWQKLDFVDGYEIKRFTIDGSDTTALSTMDDTLIDSSYNPQYTIFNTVFNVDGVQPNQANTYTITAYSDKDGFTRRESNTVSILGTLSLTAPLIIETRAVNNNTIRLYLPDDRLDSKFDTLFVLRKDDAQWECVDTLMVDAMDQLLYEYREQYLIDDIVGQSNNEIEYRLVAKGKVNALASSIATGRTLDVEGFTFVEGGDFPFGCTDCDTLYTAGVQSFYISLYEYTNDWPIAAGEFPSDGLSWVESVLECAQLSFQYERSFRLPSEMEWEYVAKWDIFFQQEFTYPWQSHSITGENTNYMNSGDSWDNGLTPVGYYDGSNGTINSFSPFGIYDMGGNVLEWCGSGSLESDWSDINGSNYIGSDSVKPMRGGGYWHSPEELKTTNRFEYDPEIQASGFGFRIIMEDTE